MYHIHDKILRSVIIIYPNAFQGARETMLHMQVYLLCLKFCLMLILDMLQQRCEHIQ